MGDRKVISKYYPIAFDPALLKRRKNPKNMQVKVRVMLPMSVRCLTCNEYIYRGKKFNARKETVIGETYLGLKIYRFYVRCTRCSNEITFKTDPKRADYLAELGAVRINNFLQENEIIMEKMKQIRLEEEKGDVLKAIENKTNEHKMELEILEGLDEIRSVNAMHSKISPDQLIEYHLECNRQSEAGMEKTDIELDPDEEEILDMLILKAAGLYINRIEDENDAEDDGDERKPSEMDAKRKQALDALGARSWTVGTTNTSKDNVPTPNKPVISSVISMKASSKPKVQIRVAVKK